MSKYEKHDVGSDFELSVPVRVSVPPRRPSTGAAEVPPDPIPNEEELILEERFV